MLLAVKPFIENFILFAEPFWLMATIANAPVEGLLNAETEMPLAGLAFASTLTHPGRTNLLQFPVTYSRFAGLYD